MKNKKIKYWVISSSGFDTFGEALNQIRNWDVDGTLDAGALVFEITETTKVYKPSMELKEIK